MLHKRLGKALFTGGGSELFGLGESNSLANVFGGSVSGLGPDGFQNAFMASLPFIGDAFSAQQAQQFSAQQAQQQMKFQQSENQKAMDFSERMANTVHQRQVADLKAAGLNPILSANSGAPSPTGISSTGASASGIKSDSSKITSDLFKSAMKKEFEIGKQTAKRIREERAHIRTKNHSEKANAQILSTTAKQAKDNYKTIQLENQNRRRAAEVEAKQPDAYFKAKLYSNMLGNALSGGRDAAIIYNSFKQPGSGFKKLSFGKKSKPKPPKTFEPKMKKSTKNTFMWDDQLY